MRAAAVDGRFVVTRNLVTNPKLRSDTTGWLPVRSTASHPDGTYTRLTCIEAFTGGAVRLDQAQRSNVTPGQLVTALAWGRSTKVIATSLQFFNAVTSLIGQVSSPINGDASGNWQAFRITAVVPPTAVTARLLLLNVSTFAIGDVMDWRDVMIHPGPIPYAYADGDTPGWVWDGTPGASTSRGYPRPA